MIQKTKAMIMTMASLPFRDYPRDTSRMIDIFNFTLQVFVLYCES